MSDEPKPPRMDALPFPPPGQRAGAMLPPPGQESVEHRGGYRKELDWDEIRASYQQGISVSTYGYDEYDAQMRTIAEGDRLYADKYARSRTTGQCL
jgi:hypothetical protein